MRETFRHGQRTAARQFDSFSYVPFERLAFFDIYNIMAPLGLHGRLIFTSRASICRVGGRRCWCRWKREVKTNTKKSPLFTCVQWQCNVACNFVHSYYLSSLCYLVREALIWLMCCFFLLQGTSSSSNFVPWRICYRTAERKCQTIDAINERDFTKPVENVTYITYITYNLLPAQS